MKPIIIAAVAVIAAVLLFVTCRGGDAKPETPPPAQGVGIVDGIQMQLDFKAKASTALKIETQWNAARQLLAMDSADPEVLRASLDSYAALQTEVAATRDQLKTSGMSDTAIDTWLEKNHWGDLQAQIATLRSRPAQQ